MAHLNLPTTPLKPLATLTLPNTPQNTYLTHLVPLNDTSAVVLASNGSLSHISLSGDSSAPEVEVSHLDTNPSNAVIAGSAEGESAYLAVGRKDGSVLLCEVQTRQNGVGLVERGSWDGPKKEPISTVIFSTSHNVIIGGTSLDDKNGPGDVAVYIWRLDTPQTTPIRSLTETHTDTLTTLTLVPPFPISQSSEAEDTTAATPATGDQPLLLTSSTDGLLNLCLPTAVTADEDPDDAVLSTLNNSSAIQHVLPLPDVNDGKVRLCDVISQDEVLKVFDLREGEQVLGRDGSREGIRLREIFGVDYVAKLFHRGGGRVGLGVGVNKEETGPLRAEVLLFEAGQIRRVVQSGNADGDEVDSETLRGVRVLRLEGGHGDEVVRDLWILGGDQNETVVSCGEDGSLKVWGLEKGDGRKRKREKDDVAMKE